MKQLLLAALCLTFLGACNEVDGTITVSTPFQIKDQKGKVQTTTNGTFKTEFKLDEGDRELEIKIKDATNNNKDDIKVKMLIPGNVRLPITNGRVELPGSQTGQAFDLVIDVDTKVDQSQPQRGFESCTYTDREYRCYDHYDPRTKKHYRECRYENVTRYGHRDVEFYYYSQTVNVQAMFTANAAALAQYNGSRSDSNKIYTYTGYCR